LSAIKSRRVFAMVRFAKYSRSKLANVSFTLELQRRLKSHGITAYATSPGPVNTALFRNFPWYAQWVLRPLTSALFRTPKQVSYFVPDTPSKSQTCRTTATYCYIKHPYTLVVKMSVYKQRLQSRGSPNRCQIMLYTYGTL
jgi:NAD(P)-dependent dehydrogenase (short-subunit alcohol dehydrogenase family)